MGLVVVAILMILFGLAEVFTGFSHQFFGLTTTQENLSTILGVALGLFYFAGGWLILVKKRWTAITAIALLGGDVVGRIAMVVTGLYPMNSFKQSFGIIAGTVIAAAFALILGSNLRYFRK